MLLLPTNSKLYIKMITAYYLLYKKGLLLTDELIKDLKYNDL